MRPAPPLPQFRKGEQALIANKKIKPSAGKQHGASPALIQTMSLVFKIELTE
jgi:hypothetical protein